MFYVDNDMNINNKMDIASIICPDCSGQGMIVRTRNFLCFRCVGTGKTNNSTCSACKGSGRIRLVCSHVCSACGGTGKIHT